MTKLTPSGMFATPYGVEVPVHRPHGVTVPDGEHVFSAEAVAFVAGIYDPAERARFLADAKRTRTFPAFEGYGGQKCPRVPLPRPSRPMYPAMPEKALTPVEAWVTGIMDAGRWCDRAAFLAGIIGENMEQVGAGPSGPDAEFYPLALATMLTAGLEHLGEVEVDCIEAAAFYAVSMHGEWIEAGAEWLGPFRDTWFRDWLRARPRYAAFARALAEPMGLPDWLHDAEGAR